MFCHVFRFGLMPHRKPINVVVGSPIQVEKILHPSKEEVAIVHAKYMASLKQLYEEYNPVYGDDGIQLVIS